MLGETAVGREDQYADGCGIYFNNGYEWISAYTGPFALDGQFDFPTHHMIKSALLEGGNLRIVDEALSTLKNAYASESTHVQFLGSHDSPRAASVANQDPALGCRWSNQDGCNGGPEVPNDEAVFDQLKKAWTVLWTIPGTPLLYYGDEVGLAGANDPDSRRDMPWTGDLNMLNFNESRSLNEDQFDLRNWFTNLATMRAQHPVLTQGEWKSIWVDDSFYIYARVLHDQDGPIPTTDVAFVALSNRGDSHSFDVDLSPYFDSTVLQRLSELNASSLSIESWIGDQSAILNGTRITFNFSPKGIGVVGLRF
jgi:glycosidase